MKLETVEIETEAGPVVINKSDFDEKTHKLYKQSDKKADKKNSKQSDKKADKKNSKQSDKKAD